MRALRIFTLTGSCLVLLPGCMAQSEMVYRRVPAMEYSQQVQEQQVRSSVPQVSHSAPISGSLNPRAQLRHSPDPEVLTNEPEGLVEGDAPYQVQRSQRPLTRPYQGPLQMGDPGVTASLWRESGPNTDIFRDHRAYRPMDLITIVVTESSQGTNQAETESERTSSILAGITNLFNYELDAVAKNPGLNPSSLVNADYSTTFEGTGETTRSGSLSGKISAMIVEVLPSGVMRLEGEKIVSVNSEEQVMVISGLIRPRDVNSRNEVDSSKIANLRVDYYGNGVVGDVQYVGWLGRLLTKIWPF